MRARPSSPLRKAASQILAKGLGAADPRLLVRKHLDRRGSQIRLNGKALRVDGRIALLAVGKAASTMASAAEEILGSLLSEGLAVDVAAPRKPLRKVRVLVAGHPVPDVRGVQAARAAESLARSLGPEDLLLVLLSGGASALLPAPVDGVSLEAKAETTRLLLQAGATIGELNTVRKHLSRLKGGGLARVAAPARVVALVLSDVVGDDPSTIGSGPTAPDLTSFGEALGVLTQRGILDRVPVGVREYLERGAKGRAPETAKPGDPFLKKVIFEIIGSNRLSVEAAANEARRLGFRPLVLTTRLEGEAREVSRVLVAILRECVESGRPHPPPVCLLAGGETTVSVLGTGRGGRNQELALSAVDVLAGFPGKALLASLATDGRDGMSDGAGAIVETDSRARADALGLASPADFLADNDSASYFQSLGDQIVTGPTGTNVVDLTILLAPPGVSPRPRSRPRRA